MKKRASIFWFTGLSGSGKSTLANYAKTELEKKELKVLVIDGDAIRSKYDVKLGFDKESVKKK